MLRRRATKAEPTCANRPLVPWRIDEGIAWVVKRLLVRRQTLGLMPMRPELHQAPPVRYEGIAFLDLDGFLVPRARSLGGAPTGRASYGPSNGRETGIIGLG